jgi:hypothetical protein
MAETIHGAKNPFMVGETVHAFKNVQETIHTNNLFMLLFLSLSSLSITLFLQRVAKICELVLSSDDYYLHFLVET